MSDFKVGDRVVAVEDAEPSAMTGQPYFRKGDHGTIASIGHNDYHVQFDEYAPGIYGDGLWWATGDKLKAIEPKHKPDAQAEIRRRMEKIRKHLAEIEELMSGEDEKEDAEEKPWYPPEDPDFGPWVEHDGSGRPGLLDGVEIEVLVRDERASKDSDRGVKLLCGWDWSWCDSRCHHGRQIVAYRIKK